VIPSYALRRAGNTTARRALTEAAHAAARTKKKRVYVRGQYHRLAVRCGKKKVAVAVGHIILRSAHYLRVQETTYHEQGLAHFDERRRARTQQRALDQLKALGYDVALTRRPRRHDARDVFQENTRFALRMFARTRA